METCMTVAPSGQQPCPRCQAQLPVYVGFPTWCDRCGWNLEPPKTPVWPPPSLIDKLHAAIGRESSRQLYDAVKARQSLDAKITPARAVALFITACVHSLTLAFVALGLWLAVLVSRSYGVFAMLASLPCFVVAWMLLPHVPSPPALLRLPADQFPVLYGLANRITRALGGTPVDGILCGMDFNAAFGRFGWRRKRQLILGLPLFAALDPQERVALLAHELAHDVNGDPARGLFVGAALDSLRAWYEIVHPRYRRAPHTRNPANPLVLIDVVALPVARLIWLIAYALVQLLWYDHQRAEYLADRLAAQVAGTAAALSLLNKVQLQELYRNTLRYAFIDHNGDAFLGELQCKVTQVPEREFERLRRLEALAENRVDHTHPPVEQRAEFLHANAASGTLALSPDEAALLEQELEPLKRVVTRRVFALDEMRFRELFGLQW